jgi:3-deoxy-D-manno-octulosonic-acid transferase
MVRGLYTLAWWTLLPLAPMRLWWRARREPVYGEALGERFGRYPQDGGREAGGDLLWIHAVSLGETRAAAPLVERLLRERPAARVLLTSMTASGREAGRSLYGDRVSRAWLPYDVPFAVEAFLDRFRPSAGMLMETELWPNLVAACRARGVPLYLVNARMSARSARGYARFAALTRPMFESLSGVAAQTGADASRLSALGAPRVAVTGNLKFDVDVPSALVERGNALRDTIGRDRPVWLAASTREGEEAMILDALQRAAATDALLLLVPRHPQRFDNVASLLAARDIAFVRRSQALPPPRETRVVLGDTMGEMLAYCSASDVAFVGGSLLPLGGQNLLEPIATGVPTLVGPHTFNFAEVTEQAIAAQAARRVADADALLAEVASLLADAATRSRMSESALRFMNEHRGAAERLWHWLAPQLDRPRRDD